MRGFILFSFLFLCLASSVNACEVMDDAGHKIMFSHPAQRIISLAPDLTELLFAAGAGDHVVGVMRGSDYPPAANKIPVVASYNAVDIEKIVALHPDLIIAWAEGSVPLQLKTLAIPVYISQQHKLTDIPKTLQRFGCLAGTEKIAGQAANTFSQRYLLLQKNYSHKKLVPLFFQISSQPLMTVSRASWINEVIELCGGKNIFADLHSPAPEVDLEAVLKQDPLVIIASSTNANWHAQWQKWPQLSAVKHQFLFSVNPDWVERAGPRLLDGAQSVCHFLDFARSSG